MASLITKIVNITFIKSTFQKIIKIVFNFTINRTQDLHHWGELHLLRGSTSEGDHQPRSGCTGAAVWLGWDGLEKPDRLFFFSPLEEDARCPVDPLR